MRRNPNPTLNSYTASAQLSALLHAIIPIHKTFNGTVYYLRPTRKIEFQNVPGPLSQFKELAQTTPSYEQAMHGLRNYAGDRRRTHFDLLARSEETRRAR